MPEPRRPLNSGPVPIKSLEVRGERILIEFDEPAALAKEHLARLRKLVPPGFRHQRVDGLRSIWDVDASYASVLLDWLAYTPLPSRQLVQLHFLTSRAEHAGDYTRVPASQRPRRRVA